MAANYCEYVKNLSVDNLHKIYHDKYYGFEIFTDDELFERLILEINQAGLSWSTILKKEDAIRRAFGGFDIRCVAAYGDEDRQRLLCDPGIIRNRLKIDAVIANARKILELQERFGSFKAWLDRNHPLGHEDWTRLFKKTFQFSGGKIVMEFLMSIGYLPGAHGESCPIYQRILSEKPAWIG